MALTRVAPAGIGSTPGTGYVIGDSFLHSRGLNATDGYYTGIVTTQSLRVIGCLLYTSPSPRDLSTSRMPSSA